MGVSPIASPIPAECSRPNVAVGGEAPKRKMGRRPSLRRRSRRSVPQLRARNPRASASASSKRDSQGWGSSSDDDDHYTSRRVPTPRVFSSSQPGPPPDDRVPTTPPVSLHACRSLTGFRLVNCPLRLRVDEALSSCREGDGDWSDAWRTQQSCSASRHATLISHLFADREPVPEFLDQSPRRSLGLALHSGHRSWRQIDKHQILSWNPGPARGSDLSLLFSHLNGPWHVICT